MNNEYFEQYLLTLKDQLIALRKALSPFESLDVDLELITQLHLQGYISDHTRVRLEMIIGGIATLDILSNKVVTDIEDHEEHTRAEITEPN